MINDGLNNRHSFVFGGKHIVFKPMTPAQIAQVYNKGKYKDDSEDPPPILMMSRPVFEVKKIDPKLKKGRVKKTADLPDLLTSLDTNPCLVKKNLSSNAGTQIRDVKELCEPPKV